MPILRACAALLGDRAAALALGAGVSVVAAAAVERCLNPARPVPKCAGDRKQVSGHIAAELRLWHALDKQLLTPFEYYGISDNTDLSGVEWSRGAYEIKALDKVYTGNDRRAELIFEQVRQRVGDPRRMRALGFCVSVAHAVFDQVSLDRLSQCVERVKIPDFPRESVVQVRW